LLHLLVGHVQWAMAATTKTTKSSSSSIEPLLFIALIILVVYFVFLRPRSQKMKAQQQELRAAHVGDEIQTIGGLVGTIVAEDGDRVTVSTGNGIELVFVRQAIGRKVPPPTPVDPDPRTNDKSEFEGPPPGFDGSTSTQTGNDSPTSAGDPESK
jgi:preprotein translocase subunit YajC